MANPGRLNTLCDKSRLCVRFTCALPVPKPYKMGASSTSIVAMKSQKISCHDNGPALLALCGGIPVMRKVFFYINEGLYTFEQQVEWPAICMADIITTVVTISTNISLHTCTLGMKSNYFLSWFIHCSYKQDLFVVSTGRVTALR